MKCRHPRFGEEEQLKHLWNACFGDEDSYVSFYFSGAYRPEWTVVCVDDGKISSMLTSLPAKLRIGGQVFMGAYVYAVATLPEYRGRGQMKRLDAFAEQLCRERELVFQVLVPAEPTLFRLYEQCGYRTFSSLETWKGILPQPTADSALAVEEISWTEFEQRRNRYLRTFPAALELAEELSGYWLQELELTGCRVLGLHSNNESGYALVYLSDSGLFVREWGMKAHCSVNDLQTIESFFHVPVTKLRSFPPLDASLYGQRTAYSMIKWLNFEGVSPRDAAANLLLD